MNNNLHCDEEAIVKTTKLIGPALDWAVAKCEGRAWPDNAAKFLGEQYYTPSTDWSQGGPIIERENLVVGPTGGGIFPDKWAASSENSPYLFAPTPLIAAMRCHVTNKLGDEVNVPKELLSETQNVEHNIG